MKYVPQLPSPKVKRNVEIFKSVLSLQKGDDCTIHTLDGTGPFSGTALNIVVSDFAEETYVLLKIRKKFRLVKIFDDNIERIERE